MESNGEFFADKLMNLANMAATALVFGQLVGGRPLQLWPLITGVALLIIFSVVSYYLRKRGH